VIKARERGDQWLADRIYSGVPAGMFGRSQEIDIGPMSGESNVAFFLDERCVEPEPGLVAAILEAAKRSTRVMAEEEIEDLVRQYRKRAASERAPKLARQTRKSGRKGK
jgi:2-isopropylmalate synthase